MQCQKNASVKPEKGKVTRKNANAIVEKGPATGKVDFKHESETYTANNLLFEIGGYHFPSSLME